MPQPYGGFAGLPRLRGNPYGIGDNATLPPESYSGVNNRYQTSTNPVGGPTFGPTVGPGTGRGYGSATDVAYDPFTGTSTSYYDYVNNLPPAAGNVKRGPAYLTGTEVDIGGPGGPGPSQRPNIYDIGPIGQNVPLNDLNVMPNNSDVYYSDTPSTNIPRATPGSIVNAGRGAGYPVLSPNSYPLPGGYGPGLGASYDPLTGMNWLDNATNQGKKVPLDANGYPIPGGGASNNTAGNWAGNANPMPWGWGPNYVDPREANSFFGGLVDWNAGSGATTGFSGAGETGLGGLGRGPTTSKGLAQAAFLRGGGGGGLSFGLKHQ